MIASKCFSIQKYCHVHQRGLLGVETLEGVGDEEVLNISSQYVNCCQTNKGPVKAMNWLQYNNIDKEASHKTCSNAEAVIHKRKHASAAALTILAQMSMDSKNPPSSWSIGVPVSLRQDKSPNKKIIVLDEPKRFLKRSKLEIYLMCWMILLWR